MIGASPVSRVWLTVAALSFGRPVGQIAVTRRTINLDEMFKVWLPVALLSFGGPTLLPLPRKQS